MQGDQIQGLLSGREDRFRQKWRRPKSIFQALFAFLLWSAHNRQLNIKGCSNLSCNKDCKFSGARAKKQDSWFLVKPWEALWEVKNAKLTSHKKCGITWFFTIHTFVQMEISTHNWCVAETISFICWNRKLLMFLCMCYSISKPVQWVQHK